ncbi:MAG: hypothetical protein AAGC56_01640 [Pseudomonadota bacterium]
MTVSHPLRLLAASLMLGFAAPPVAVAQDDTSAEEEAESAEEPRRRRRNPLADFRRTGETQTCVQIRNLRTLRSVAPRTLLAQVGNQYYVNKTSGNCGRQSGFRRLQYRSFGSQLCRGEIVTSVDNSTGFVAGSCSLGDFERLERRTDEQQ